MPDYKVCYIAMVVIALAFSYFIARKRGGLPLLRFYSVTVLICLMSFIGGRIFYEIRNYDHHFAFSLSDAIVRSGTESTGAYMGGIISAFLFLSWMRIDMLIAFDVYAPILALSQCIGRLGCLMSGCCFGKVTSLPWAISFPKYSQAFSAQLEAGMITGDSNMSLPVHPTQIYEMIFGITLFGILLWTGRRIFPKGYRMFFLLVCYAVFRFFIEFLRGDDRGILFAMSVPQVFSVFLFMLGLGGIVYCHKKNKKQYDYPTSEKFNPVDSISVINHKMEGSI
jgi:phosphatidylglycerol:prolipoprotein diacylglycerol transferase